MGTDAVDWDMDCYHDYAAMLAFIEEEYNAGNITAEERDEGIGEANEELEICRANVVDAQDNPRAQTVVDT